jgi:ribonuclease D
VIDHRIVETEEALHEVVEALASEPRFALDTEFHRERTYWPKVALVQIAWPDDLVLIDPLAVDMAPLAGVLDDQTLVVAHAAAQDLEVLEICCGAVPARLFDTQIAAGFLGMATPSLAALHERELGIRLPKSSRLTDWLVRPLGAAQLDYAASDVAHLLEIHDQLSERLSERGRSAWAEAEFELLLARDRGPRNPEEAWRRIKEARHLRGSAVSVARSVAAWRERRAAEIDQPPRFVMADIAVVAVAQSTPQSGEDLARVRGVDRGITRGPLGQQILDAVSEGLALDWRPPRPTRRSVDGRELRPAVALVAAWVNQVARDRDLDPTLLATRADVEALVRGDDDARLANGWRADLAGAPIRRLVAGDAALAFDGGSVVLEERSNRPIA